MEKTLYITDLDGTLLTPEARVSNYTRDTLNRLSAQGMLFSYATARSIVSAGKVTEGVAFRLPVITHNGVFLNDGKTGEHLAAATFSKSEREDILQAFSAAGMLPMTYSMIEGRERVSYLLDGCKGQAGFVRLREGDVRLRQVAMLSELYVGEAYYFLCIDDKQKLRPVYERLKEKYRCYFQRDMYDGEQWLEVLSMRASKAAAALRLKEMLGATRLICFGDAVNDTPMFEIADECYAVANAAPALKKIATGIIGANTEDGVARFLSERMEKIDL